MFGHSMHQALHHFTVQEIRLTWPRNVKDSFLTVVPRSYHWYLPITVLGELITNPAMVQVVGFIHSGSWSQRERVQYWKPFTEHGAKGERGRMGKGQLETLQNDSAILECRLLTSDGGDGMGLWRGFKMMTQILKLCMLNKKYLG